MQTEWIEYYLFSNNDEVQELTNLYNDLSPRGIRARLSRTYPSLVRDLHFHYLLKESKIFERVEYSISLDVEYGVDLTIYHKGNKFYVHNFTKTENAEYWREQKEKRHMALTDGVHLDFKIELANENCIRSGKVNGNPIYLYSMFHASVLRERLDNILLNRIGGAFF